MSSSQPPKHEHRGRIARNVIFSAAIGTVCSAVAYARFPIQLTPMPSLIDRLAFTLKWNTLSISVLFIMISNIGNRRFYSGQHNPFSEVDKEKIEVHVRVLQNTLEQFVLSFTLQLITTTWLDESQMRIIPIIVVLFVIGRILFWKGYLNPSYGRTQRSLGLPLTIFTSAAMLCFCAYMLAKDCARRI